MVDARAVKCLLMRYGIESPRKILTRIHSRTNP
jgi:hypothetical protein